MGNKECTKSPPRSFFNNLRPIRTNSDYKLHTWDNCNYFPIRRAVLWSYQNGQAKRILSLRRFFLFFSSSSFTSCVFLQPTTKKQLQCTRHDDKIVVSPTLPFLLLLYICWACIIISGKKYPARSWAIASTAPASGSAQQHISCTYEFVHLGTERSFDTNT